MPERWGGGGGGLIIGCIVLFTGRRAYNWGKRWWGLSAGRDISGGLRYEKQLLGQVFVHDIRNNQGRGKCEADNTNRDLDYSGYHKNQL